MEIKEGYYIDEQLSFESERLIKGKEESRAEVWDEIEGFYSLEAGPTTRESDCEAESRLRGKEIARQQGATCDDSLQGLKAVISSKWTCYP